MKLINRLHDSQWGLMWVALGVWLVLVLAAVVIENEQIIRGLL